MLSLKELCKEVGVTRRAIQGYEKKGLIRAIGKNKYGYLIYGKEEVLRAKEIYFFAKNRFSVKRNLFDY